MTLGQAIVLGIVQGLTEFLPVSSTAHLYLVPQLLGWGKPDTAFVAVIQLGTLAAVFAYFARDIAAITKASLASVFGSGRPALSGPGGEGTAVERRGYNPQLGWMIALGTVPVVVLGLLFKKQIETTLTSLYVIACAMIVLAVVLAIAEWLTKRRQTLRGIEQVGWCDAMVVGFAQSVALIPGSSRSGCTIAGGLLRGFDRETAARFSFLLSLPAVFAAGIFELIKARHELLATPEHIHNLVVATVVSGVVGYASIAFLLGYLKKHTMWLFIIYRLILGGLLLALLRVGKLTP